MPLPPRALRCPRCEGGCERLQPPEWRFCSLQCKLQALALSNSPAGRGAVAAGFAAAAAQPAAPLAAPTPAPRADAPPERQQPFPWLAIMSAAGARKPRTVRQATTAAAAAAAAERRQAACLRNVGSDPANGREREGCVPATPTGAQARWWLRGGTPAASVAPRQPAGGAGDATPPKRRRKAGAPRCSPVL